MAKNCAVRLSPYCDTIISMRMQGIPYGEIERWLISQGKQHRISASTIHRNIKKSGLRVELPAAEEIAEQWGGRIDIEPVRELAGQILMQRRRIDRLLKREEDMQEERPGYHDRRISGEMKVLNELLKTLYGTMKTPEEAVKEAMAAASAGARDTFFTDDAVRVVTQMILDGEISVGEEGTVEITAGTRH